jgi:large subunit ribosomal protein L22
MKRIRPAPMGRAYRYQRRMAHIEIVLAEKSRNGASAETAEEASAAPAKKPARRPLARKKAPAKKAAGKKK